MGGSAELSYCELRAKEIINVIDGRRLGRIIDLIFSSGRGEIKGIVVPYSRRALFSRNQDIFIPWQCIQKIGEDVILVKIVLDGGFNNRKDRKSRMCMPNFDEACDCEPHDKRGCDCEPPCDDGAHNHKCDDRHFQHDDKHHKEPVCDHKCEKCMLFDCAYRWKNGFGESEQIIIDNNKYK